MIDRVTTLAAEEGLSFHLDRPCGPTPCWPTGCSAGTTARCAGGAAGAPARAYFTEGRNVGDPDTLAELAAECGLEPTEVLGYLASDAGRARWRAT